MYLATYINPGPAAGPGQARLLKAPTTHAHIFEMVKIITSRGEVHRSRCLQDLPSMELWLVSQTIEDWDYSKANRRTSIENNETMTNTFGEPHIGNSIGHCSDSCVCRYIPDNQTLKNPKSWTLEVPYTHTPHLIPKSAFYPSPT